MKIVQLNVENVKRLTAVSITPDGSVVTIGGLNGAGKSSVLDAIAMALGGQKLVPEEPIHAGQSEAKIEVDLGKFVVTRKFARDVTHEADCNSKIEATSDDPALRECSCKPTFGTPRSSLVIKTKDGAQYASPQKMLDELVGQLTFDPLAFVDMDSQRQLETLRKLVGLDFSGINAERKEFYDERTRVNREIGLRDAKLKDTKPHEGVPAEPVDLKVISDEMHQAEVARQAHRDLVKAYDSANADQGRAKLRVVESETKMVSIRKRIQELENELAGEVERYDAAVKHFEALNVEVEDRARQANEAEKALPNLDDIRQRLGEVQATNEKVQANKRRAALVEEHIQLVQQAENLTKRIEVIDARKAEMIATAQWPVPGLGLSDSGVTFDGLPFKQASTAAQIRTSVAVGLALNPNFKVLLVKRGNDLDSNSLKAIAEQAAAADAQLWIERVAESKDGVSVLIEDGHVA